MKHFEFKGLDEHVAEHEALLEQVLEYQDRIAANDGVSIDEFLDFLAGWLLDHILGVDQLYGPYLSRLIDNP